MSFEDDTPGERNFSKIPDRILHKNSPLALTRRAVLLGLVALSGCGFAPAYAPGGIATRWQNTVTLDTPDTVFGFRMRHHLRETFGPVTAPTYTLSIIPQTAPVPATITEDGDITRFNITGNAEWSLTDVTGAEINKGLAQTFTSYSATSTTVATQSAEGAARDRLAVALADLIVQQMLTTP